MQCVGSHIYKVHFNIVRMKGVHFSVPLGMKGPYFRISSQFQMSGFDEAFLEGQSAQKQRNRSWPHFTIPHHGITSKSRSELTDQMNIQHRYSM